MKKIIILFVFILTGCQLPSWQPYNVLNQPTQTATAQPSPTGTATAGAACIVSADSLNLRNGAGLSHSVIAWPQLGAVLTMTGKQRGVWIEVTTAQGLTGWVHKKYCKG